MSYTHVVVTMKAKGKAKEVKHIETDLEENFVLDRIVKPYVGGASIFVDGSRIDASDVEKISVFSSDRNSKELLADAQRKSDASSARAAQQGIFMTGFVTIQGAIQGEGTEDITRKLFNAAQGF